MYRMLRPDSVDIDNGTGLEGKGGVTAAFSCPRLVFFRYRCHRAVIPHSRCRATACALWSKRSDCTVNTGAVCMVRGNDAHYFVSPLIAHKSVLLWFLMACSRIVTSLEFAEANGQIYDSAVSLRAALFSLLYGRSVGEDRRASRPVCLAVAVVP